MKIVFTLAFPAILESLMVSMVQYVDTAMVGSLGPTATAAVAASTPVMWMLNSTIQAIAVGGTVTVAQAIGAKNPDKARRVSGQAFLAVGVLSLSLMTVLLAFGDLIPDFMGAEEDIHESAAAYIRITALGMPFHCLTMVFFGILRGAGDTRTPMKVNVFINIANVLGNFLLIYPSRIMTVGSLRVPMWGADMGVEGAALATTMARIVAGIIIMQVMIRREDVTLIMKGLKLEKDLLGEMLRIGIPTAMERLAISGGQLCYVRVVSGLGTITLAAHQLALTAESISYMPANGFQIAATTLVGNAVGAKDYDSAKERASMTFRLCAICTLAMSLILFFGSRMLIGFFTPSEAVVEQGSLALRIIAFVEIFYAMASIYTGALRGAGDTKQPFYVCVLTMWGIRIPMAMVFVQVFRLGIAGAWMAMGLDLICRGSLMAYRFRKGKWQQKK
ncbi:MAG: MATE family efflux transporter [Firmicutes bacterium]|nr:MATE family efflux transporter [Bacillota bacterium]